MSRVGQAVTRERATRKPRTVHVVLVRGDEIWGFQDLMLRGRPGILKTRAGYVGPAGARPTYHRRPHHQLAIEVTFSPALVSRTELVSFIVQAADGSAASRGGRAAGRGVQQAGLVYYRDAAEFTCGIDALRAVSPGALEFDPYQLVVPVETFHEAEPEQQE